MNRVLVESIRQRMREQTTEHLLELWTTNDRVMWSPEAFEAVKAILAERGHPELPPQIDPAPVANRFSPASPEAPFWLGWLRPILWIAMVPAALHIGAGAMTWSIAEAVYAPAASSFTLADMIRPLLGEVVIPVWLIVGGVACLRLKSWGRTLLLLYPLPVLAFVVWNMLSRVGTIFDEPGWHAVVLGLYHAQTVLGPLVVPAILQVLLRRPEIRALFTPALSGFSIEPSA